MRPFWTTLFLLAAWLAAMPVCADIGFAAAATMARAEAPGQRLLALRLRTRNASWVYECDLVNTPPTAFTTVVIDRDSGATVDLVAAPIPPDEFQPTQQAIQRLNYATADFADAWAIANAFTGRSDTERIDLLYEAGVLAFRVSYFRANGFTEVDSITGTVIPGVIPGLGIEPTVSVAELAGALAHAAWIAGPAWVPIEATVLARIDGFTVRVLLANRSTGLLMRPEIVQGFYIPAPPFAPIGSQASRAEAVGDGSSVVCRALDALASAEATSPGFGVNGVSLEPLPAGGHRWVTRFVDTFGIERDAHADASIPAARKATSIVAPMNIPPGDLTRDGAVDARDLAEVLAAWGAFNPLLDLNESGLVDAGDLAIVLGGWTP